jgi:hypothetical protein
MNRANHCPINIGWHRLQNGTLRVDLDTCEVFSIVRGQCRPLVFEVTKDRVWNGQRCSGGYLSTKLCATIAGVSYRQRAYLHRLVWMAKHGVELTPLDHVDHGPRGRPCNHWSNLECVTISENMRRRSAGNSF